MQMNDSIKEVFDSIHVEESLKEDTKIYVNQALKRRHKKRVRYVLATVAILMVFIGIGGYKAYYTPVAALSLDMDPSIELEVNMFNRVISMKEYGNERLGENVSVDHMDYIEAIQTLLSTEASENLEVTIYCHSKNQTQKIQDTLTKQISISKEYVYHTSNHDEVNTAHELGMSFGKYRAYLSLLEVDPDMTVEEVEALSMSEIHDCLRGQLQQQNGQQNQHHGRHHEQ